MNINQVIAQIEFQLPQLCNGTSESNGALLNGILRPWGESLIGTSVDAGADLLQVEATVAKAKLAEALAVCAELAAVLEKHHQHGNEGPEVLFTEGEMPLRNPELTEALQQVPTNLAEAYQESDLWDQTRDAICKWNGIKPKETA